MLKRALRAAGRHALQTTSRLRPPLRKRLPQTELLEAQTGTVLASVRFKFRIRQAVRSIKTTHSLCRSDGRSHAAGPLPRAGGTEASFDR